MHAFRRDPNDETSGVDWPQTFVAASVVGVAAWGLWFFLRDRGDVPGPFSSTSTRNASVSAPPSPGAAARVGDVVLVETSFVENQLGPAHTPTSGLVKLRVTIAEAASPGEVLAVSADPAFPAGAPVVVPRSEIHALASSGGDAPFVPAVVPTGSTSSNPVFMIGDPTLVTGQHYRARLQLSGLEATFATKPLVAAKFQSGGFDQVSVYQDPSELPAGWPASTAQAGRGVWWVEGIWAKPTEIVKREPQIIQVWAQ